MHSLESENKMESLRETKSPLALSGVFNAERFWREQGLSKLPQVADKQAERIVGLMDELMFSLARPGDYVLTRQPMHATHLDYLASIGFDFQNVVCDTADENMDMMNLPKLPSDCTFSSFAVLPHHKQLSELLGIAYGEPGNEIIRRVNGKHYSTDMRSRLGIPNPASIATSAEEVQEIALEMLKEGPMLIKDDYGVSGKGIIHVREETVLRRIASFLAAQEKKGCHTRLILEPLLPKTLDFSTLFHLSEKGDFRLVSVQQMINSDFAFRGIITPNEAFHLDMETTGYLELMEQIGKSMYADGYWGDVCVDSMRLEGNEWMPIVEINARKSMSHMKNGIDAFVARHGMQSMLTYYSISYTHEPSYEQILDCLGRERLLFDPKCGMPGIVLLSANTLLAGSALNVPGKGRLYVAIVYRMEEDCLVVETRLQEIFAELGLRILN
ncbi:hypothetical protein [Paenibacillus plantarum]|nr:hypothetical protein [Paenibacillus plantarum]